MDPNKIELIIQEILNREFSGIPHKTKIDRYGNRLNFSCPYCGDSDEKRKKRGNFYLDTQGYKCYNGGCGVFKSSLSFFYDFGASGKLSTDERNEIKTILEEVKGKRRPVMGSLDIGLLFDNMYQYQCVYQQHHQQVEKENHT